MDQTSERRYYQRLPLKLSVHCQTVGLSSGKFYTGSTIDVSTGGMLLEVNEPGLDEGQLLSIEMAVPPTTGLAEHGGRFSSYARVCRVLERRNDSSAKAVALEFCDSPRFQP
jgi:hypothetical protein